MARVPEPSRGLIFRYGYVWLDDWLAGKIDPVKDRPVCIVLELTESLASGLRTVDGAGAGSGDILVMPITRSSPTHNQAAVELSRNDKRACGLDPDTKSWVVVSEYNVDMWPSPDMALVPGAVPPRFEYGYAPPGLMKRISEAFRSAYQSKKTRGLNRN